MFVWGGGSVSWGNVYRMCGIECRGGTMDRGRSGVVGYRWGRAGSPSESPIAGLNRAEFKRL